MTWSWIYGCANGCTWQETLMVFAFAVLAFAVWWSGLHWMAREYEKHNED